MQTFRLLIASTLCASVLVSCAAHHETFVLAQPEVEIATGFNNISHGGRMYFAGQPTPEGLAQLKERGVGTVISIRTAQEHAERIEFDEKAEVERLGMRFVMLPMTPALFTPELVDDLARELAMTDGAVLLHCGSSNRVGSLWAAYLIEHAGYGLEEAIEHGKGAGISRDSSEQAVRDYVEKFDD